MQCLWPRRRQCCFFKGFETVIMFYPTKYGEVSFHALSMCFTALSPTYFQRFRDRYFGQGGSKTKAFNVSGADRQGTGTFENGGNAKILISTTTRLRMYDAFSSRSPFESRNGATAGVLGDATTICREEAGRVAIIHSKFSCTPRGESAT